ncbi:MAG: hypothetical protein IJV31_02565 [Clostridia bacterium]|nr:hypothetical protein [Clostridia bacterium]
MLRIFFQYITLLNKIRKSKQKGYEGIQVSLIYPVNQKRLKEKGYSVYEPGLFKNHYTIRWVD